MLCIYNSCLHISSVQPVTAGCAHTKIGNDTEKISKPLRKDDMLNREAFHIFFYDLIMSYLMSCLNLTYIQNYKGKN